MKQIDYELVGKRLKQAREEKGISLEDAGKKVGVNKSTILRWENGQTEKFKIPTLEILADYYSVNPSWLVGKDSNKFFDAEKLDSFGNSVLPIPVLGTVKAGYDYLAQENWIGTIDVETSLVGNGKDYFALMVHGNSMSPVLIKNDIVIIKKQNDFENGDIVVAIINGDEATIKKGKKNDSSILLQPLNPSYEPLIFTYDEMKTIPVTIIGIVKQLKREF